MPLSKPVPRKHIHTREIECKGYEREDGLWDIEGRIIDTKTYTFENIDRGGVASGEPVHHMVIRLTVDDHLVVQNAEASTEASPYNVCGDINPEFAKLKGVAIAPGWRREVVKRMGGVKGCTHINDLVIGPLAVTAYQTVIPARKKRRNKPSDGKRPAIIDTCHAYADGGDVVKRLWPDFYEKTEN
ncbi:MAG: DUF2889 domain-containing protein [Rhodospirillales bacterium]|nr:DUF2889 domain-containing protein [Rhodospirillales bacterium]